MRIYKALLLVCIVYSASNISYAQDRQLVNNLDRLLTPQFKTTDPGYVMLVAKKGQVIYQKAFGTANLELNVPLKPGMVFNLASITTRRFCCATHV